MIAAIAFASRWHLRDARADRCRLDGAAIVASHRVELLDHGRPCASFCSIACALAWPERPADPSWQVTDEASGAPVDAAIAAFVRSRVPAEPVHHELLHAFRSASDAADHASRHGGVPVDNPFAASAGERRGT